MKAEPGRRGPFEGEGSRFLPLRSNSFSGADSSATGATPLGLHPKSSMDGSPRPFSTIPPALNELAQKNGDARRVFDVQPAQGGCPCSIGRQCEADLSGPLLAAGSA